MCLPCPGIECLLDALEFNPNADELNDAINECRQAPLNTVGCLAQGLVTRSHVLRALVIVDGPDHAGAEGSKVGWLQAPYRLDAPPLCMSAQHAYIFCAAVVIVVLISADRTKVHNAKDWTLTYPYYKEPWQHNLGSSREL